MGKRILTAIEPSSYDNILELHASDCLTDSNRYILHEQNIYIVKEILDGDVLLESGELAREEVLLKVFVVLEEGIPYVILSYINTNKIIIIYKDIEYTGSYYGDVHAWIKKSFKFINDYFKNIIDGKMQESIDSIDVDASTVLAIVNKYALPSSRDMMLVHAIDKYSNEMQELLGAINDVGIKDSFSGVVTAMKEFLNPSKKKPEGRKVTRRTSKK